VKTVWRPARRCTNGFEIRLSAISIRRSRRAQEHSIEPVVIQCPQTQCLTRRGGLFRISRSSPISRSFASRFIVVAPVVRLRVAVIASHDTHRAMRAGKQQALLARNGLESGRFFATHFP
jgi:hypothetical protein